MAKSSADTTLSQQSGKSPMAAITSRLTWHELLAIPVVAIGVAIYWFRDYLAQLYFTGQNEVLFYLGVGVIPVALWLVAFVGVLALRPRLFKHYRLWVASIGLVALTLGVLSFFQTYDGLLHSFTLNGYVNLGGETGDLIAGPVEWQAVLRMVGIGAAIVALASPVFAAFAVMALGKILVYAYISLVLAARGIGKIYRKKNLPTEMAEPVLETTSNGSDAYSSYAKLRSLDELDISAQNGGTHMPEPASAFTGSIISTLPSASFLGDEYEDEEDISSDINGELNSAFERHGSDGINNAWADVAEPVSIFDQASPSALDDVIEFERSDGLEPEDSVDDEGTSGLRNKFNRFWGSDSTPAPQPVVEPENIVIPINESSGSNGHIVKTISLLGKRKEKWSKPPISILKDLPGQGISESQILETAQIIKKTLGDYDIEVEVGQIRPGPTVTMYGFIPGWVRRDKLVKKVDENGLPVLDERGKQIVTRMEQKTRVKVDSILSREKDLSLALKTPSLRIETPVMGKAQIGIEIPNANPSPVTLLGVMNTEEYQSLKRSGDLPVAFGKGSGGETVVIDLAKMPHLLIAGATGSGKSVCLNSILTCLLMEKSPAEMRMLLIDPKRVELTPYNGIPHLLAPVVVNSDEVVGMLKGVISEMMDRYRRMEEVSVRNIEVYNKRVPEDQMPFLMVVVDELADLMMTAAFDVEQALCRLAQLGRATGIHLILATQRPSVDVVTGLIKANFPSRVSFGVTSSIDSRTILDATGAEKLIGKGDMLYLPRDASRPQRIQGAYVSDAEIENLVKFWQSTPRGWTPQIFLRPVKSEDGSDGDTSDGKDSYADEMFGKAVELAHAHNKLSTSLLQRRLRIGYPRAARLMDELEEKSVVGPSDGSKSRDVIMNQV
ncbi:MAG: DNA translocase FtsK [Chloroflexi bacterium]|nr:DNA translocase FtsK [Chloroflexota bacterium]